MHTDSYDGSKKRNNQIAPLSICHIPFRALMALRRVLVVIRVIILHNRGDGYCSALVGRHHSTTSNVLSSVCYHLSQAKCSLRNPVGEFGPDCFLIKM